MNYLLNLVWLFALFALTPVHANPIVAPTAPAVEARGYVLVDFYSGQVLAEMNSDQRMEPASLTKLMTAYTLFHELKAGHIKLTDTPLVSEKAWRTEGSRMFVQVGTTVPLEDLLRGMIIQSGNDATVTLAEHAAGSEEAFAMLMNANAQRLGMTNSHFTNSTGLPDPNLYVTARDMSKLAMAIIREFPEYYRYYSEKQFSYNNITQENRNRLLFRDGGVDGLKTGHTESAGYCLVSSAKRGEMRLVSVLMGAKNDKTRADESQKLLDFGFRFYETHLLYAANKPLKTLRIWKGESESLPVGIDRDLYITVPRGLYTQLSASVSVEKQIFAPAGKGKPYGRVSIKLGDSAVAERPLVALTEVKEGGILRRATDSVKLMFE